MTACFPAGTLHTHSIPVPLPDNLCRARKEYIVPILSDNTTVLTAPPGALQNALTDIANSVGEKLGAALAHTSRSKVIESRRQIQQVLGRKLEPLLALELVTLLLAQGREARELRAAFVNLLSMTDTPEWAASLKRGPSAMLSSDDEEAKFLASEEAAGAQDIARCGECLARTASERVGESLTSDEAASLQWAHCAQCRCGTSAWYQR